MAITDFTDRLTLITGGASGIDISVLCPGFVKSNIHESGQNRPAHLREGSAFAESEATLAQREVGEDRMGPRTVDAMVVEAILRNDLYIITYGEFRDRMEARARDLLAATPHAELQL